MRFDRRALWNHYGEQSPVNRREDFFEALRQLADGELYDAVQLVNGSARAVHVLLARDAEAWEPLFYDDVDEIDQDVARELLTAQGYDITTVVPDAHHVYRPRVKHDPTAPRTCTKCRETKLSSEFDRRGVPGTPGYDRFQSHCQDCKRE